MPPNASLFIDVTRCTYRLTGSTPTGIDRVEFAYASHLLRDQAVYDPISVFTAPFFTGVLRNDLMHELLRRIERAWRLHTPADSDQVYLTVRELLHKPVDDGPLQERRIREGARNARLRRNMVFPAWDLLRSPRRLKRRIDRIAAPMIYLNTSHNQLETPQRLAWTKSGRVRSVFFIHDTIPIDHPEYVAPSSPRRHERRLETVATLASLVIVNSDLTRRRLQDWLERMGRPCPQIAVVPLGVADIFVKEPRRLGGAPRPPGDGHPYFVTLSTIEPRKNLLFLFAVWRRLVERLGERAPRLVVVGNRGWENENIVDVLERSVDLGRYLIEVSDLCDAGLAALIGGARAMLQPSSTEGFGLPLIEGLSLGVPVVASRIPAHMEAGGESATYIDPIDGPGWVDAIERLLDDADPLTMELRGRASAYRPMSWSQHVGTTLDIIGSSGLIRTVEARNRAPSP